jgi:NTP pyrophosphatase (non-canonical NTP hydrolase)
MTHQLTILQNERNDWVASNFPGDMVEDSIMGAVEEMGELAHHWLKMKQGIRGTEEEHIDGMLDAVADAVIFLAGVASHLGADYGELVQDTWDKVKQRDWQADPQRGGSDAALQQRPRPVRDSPQA